MTYKICILPGDGIGKEVVPEAVRVLKKLPLDFKFFYAEAGYDCFQKTKTALPDKTLSLVKKCDATLFGAVTTPPNIKNYKSVIVNLRKKLDLFVNLRPVKSYSRKKIDLVFIRENTEGLYSGIERYEDNKNTAITERIITRSGCERLIKFAFEYAAKNNRKKITIVHKANILRKSCGMFRKTGMEISKKHKDIRFDEMLVDAMAMRLVKDPEHFDVIATTNFFGDILSDEASALVGGLGMIPSANIGKKNAIFEPVHGSAPDIAGKKIANPCAAILSAQMMLDFLGENRYADMIDDAVKNALKKNSTKDLGGNLSTKEFTDRVIGLM
ncbi:NAD-dependent isocitrate dehydrogenase [Candidatus Woesearchaeota archaeon]|nr:NAD-dependent isocitrate dehydrogenase [Candidatus Woesearchaeota archaeon]